MARSAPSRTVQAHFRYLRVLLGRFRFTFLSLLLIVLGGAGVLWWLMRAHGAPMPFSRAVLGTYFLLFAQPTFDIPDVPALQALAMIIPPLGILTVAEGLVRFAVLLFARNRNDKEWFTVLAQIMQDHIIVCGAGRVGFRIYEQFSKLGVPMVMLERREDAPFISTLRSAGVPVLIEDARTLGALEQANIRQARAIVAATDDDLANLNIALDARRVKPGIRVVLRLFDDDLVTRMKETLAVEAFSTSALAAPALAVAALDPALRNSFEVGGRLMVVAELPVGEHFAGRTVAALRDEQGALVLHIARTDGTMVFDPQGTVRLQHGDRVTLQATMDAYRLLPGREERAA